MSDRIQIFGVKLELSTNKPRSNRILLNRMTKMIMPSILVANVVLFAPWDLKTPRKQHAVNLRPTGSFKVGPTVFRTINVRPERSASLKY